MPFLVELLSISSFKEKDGILSLLQAIATGYPSRSEGETWYQAVCKREGRDFHIEVASAATTVKRAHEAVRAGLDQYIPFTRSKDHRERRTTAELLCSLPEDAPRLFPLLYEWVANEREDATRAELIEKVMEYLLATQAKHPEAAKQFVVLFRDLAHSAHLSQMVRFAAVRAIARVAPHDMDDTTYEVILETIAHPQDVDPNSIIIPEPEYQPVWEATVVENAVEALSSVDRESSLSLLIHALSTANTTEHAHHIAVMLLSLSLIETPKKLAFGIKPRWEANIVYCKRVHPPTSGIEGWIYPVLLEHTDIATLTVLQKQTVIAVLNNKQIWRIRSNILEAFGIAISRSDLIGQLTD